jgi:hypothetical protein
MRVVKMVLLASLACGGGVVAQEAPSAPAAPPPGEVLLEAAVDRNAVTIGDPITLTLRLVYPEGTRIVSVAPRSPLEPWVVLDRQEGPPRVMEDGASEVIHTLQIAVYEVGPREIPAFDLVHAPPSGEEGTVASKPIPIDVASVLAEGESEPADIKGPATMPEPALWPWVLAGLVVLAAVLWLVWRYRRRPLPVEAGAEPAGPPRPAHEVAYAELERLLSSDLLERGEVKKFYIELAEIIRRYLEGRFGIDTFERTSSEILESLRIVRVSVRTTTAIREFLLSCDMVKFAKYWPGSEETRTVVEGAYGLIDDTKPEEEMAPAAAAAGGEAG